MGNCFEPVLSEEQMAAYLDGMLSTEESNMVEELIDSNPEMVEIQEAIDSVDTTYLYVTNDEIPIECLADDFSLPDVSYGNHHDVDPYNTEDCIDADRYNDVDDYQDNSNEIEYNDEISEVGNEDLFLDDGFDDVPF